MPEIASPLGTVIEVASLTPSGYEPMLTVLVWPMVGDVESAFRFNSSTGPTIGLSKENKKIDISSEATIPFCRRPPMHRR